MLTEIEQAARRWQEMPRPVENFRSRRGKALTYGIESDLEHQAKYLETMLDALHAGAVWDFRMRASDELRDLRDFRERTLALELPHETANPLLNYMAITQVLLEAIVRTVSSR